MGTNWHQIQVWQTEQVVEDRAQARSYSDARRRDRLEREERDRARRSNRRAKLRQRMAQLREYAH